MRPVQAWACISTGCIGAADSVSQSHNVICDKPRSCPSHACVSHGDRRFAHRHSRQCHTPQSALFQSKPGDDEKFTALSPRAKTQMVFPTVKQYEEAAIAKPQQYAVESIRFSRKNHFVAFMDFKSTRSWTQALVDQRSNVFFPLGLFKCHSDDNSRIKDWIMAGT